MTDLLGRNGTPYVELGGERSWKQFVKGDIVVTFQWLGGIKKDPVACMVLFPSVLKLEGGAYAIPQDNAYEYVTSEGNPTPYLLTAAYNAAQTMGFFPDQSTVFRIVDIITDYLPELIRMPSDQPQSLDIKGPVLGIEATAKVEGQVVREEVI